MSTGQDKLKEYFERTMNRFVIKKVTTNKSTFITIDDKETGTHMKFPDTIEGKSAALRYLRDNSTKEINHD